MAWRPEPDDRSPWDPRSFFRSRNVLHPCLLLLVEGTGGYGYELQQQLSALTRERWDSGTIYRALNTLEENGLVVSHWEPSGHGPARRRYSILPAGQDRLAEWVQDIADLNVLFLEILVRFERGVPQEPPGGPPRRPGHVGGLWIRQALEKADLERGGDARRDGPSEPNLEVC